MKKKIFFAVTIFYVLYVLFPLFADVLRLPAWLPSIFSVIVISVCYPNIYTQKPVIYAFIYFAMLAIFLMVGRDLTIGIGSVANNKKILIEMAYVWPTVIILCVFTYLQDDYLNEMFVKWSLSILFISFVVAVPLMRQYGSIRDAFTEQTQEEFRVTGLPSYPLMHSYTFLVPVFCYWIKVCTPRMKIWILSLFAFLCFVIYDTFVTTSLIVTIVVILFTILYKEKQVTLAFFVAILGMIILYVLYKSGVFIPVMDRLIDFYEDTPVQAKMIDVKNSMIQENLVGGTITGRQSLHQVSWDSFMLNPLIGTANVGGHSSLLDRFGGMGVAVGIPFVVIFISCFSQQRKWYHTKSGKFFWYIGIGVGLVFLYAKGLWGGCGWIMYVVIVPMAINVIEKKTVNIKNNTV